MPDKTIDELTVSGSLTGTEKVPMWQSGTVYALLSTIKTYVLNAYAGAASIVTVGTITAGTWSAKFAPRVTAQAATGTLTPNIDSGDSYVITAQNAGLTIANPTGTPVSFQKLFLRIKDNGSARTLTFGSDYRFQVGSPAPAATTPGNTHYFEFVYNSADSKWDATHNFEIA